jgi:RNA polymerase primary sigma factor
MRQRGFADGLGGASPPVGTSLAHARRLPLLTRDEERSLVLRAQAGESKARSRLLEANLLLVAKAARRYNGRGVPLADLMQEGAIGLMRAAETYDTRREARFATWATYWVRKALQDAVAKHARLIRLPGRVEMLLNAALRTERVLRGEIGREPTLDEVAAALEIAPEELRRSLESSQPTMSLDAPRGSETGLVDDLEDPSAPLDATVQESIAGEVLRATLQGLEQRERQIIELRFGLTDGRARSQSEIGVEVGLSRERVCQLEARVLAVLRAREDVQGLRGIYS